MSRSTRRIDLTPKPSRYDGAGCPAYWVVDPEQPSVRVWLLTAGRYGNPIEATGAEPLTVEHPFTITVVPAELIGPARGIGPA